MSNYIISGTTLTGIADAIRSKTGASGTILPTQMATQIGNIQTGGITLASGLPISGVNGYKSYEVQKLINENFFDDIYCPELTYLSLNGMYSFLYGDIDWSSKIISTIDMGFQGRLNMQAMYQYSEIVKPHKFVFNFVGGNNGTRIDGLNCAYMFQSCSYMVEVPNDFITYGYGVPDIRSGQAYYCNHNGVFYQCNNLVSIPDNFLVEYTSKQDYGTYSSKAYCYQAFVDCHVLDQVIGCGIPNVNGNTTMTDNAFWYVVHNCYRLKRFTCATNNGTPYIANIINQQLDMTTCGYLPMTGNMVNKPSSWPEENWPSFENWITDQSSYNTYKNHSRAVACGVGWSRYNHSSMVETINSLPDTSAVSLPSNPTNRIIFASGQGSLTDEGGPENLTQQEIQVATDKGWQVVIQ